MAFSIFHYVIYLCRFLSHSIACTYLMCSWGHMRRHSKHLQVPWPFLLLLFMSKWPCSLPAVPRSDTTPFLKSVLMLQTELPTLTSKTCCNGHSRTRGKEPWFLQWTIWIGFFRHLSFAACGWLTGDLERLCLPHARNLRKWRLHSSSHSGCNLVSHCWLLFSPCPTSNHYQIMLALLST